MRQNAVIGAADLFVCSDMKSGQQAAASHEFRIGDRSLRGMRTHKKTGGSQIACFIIRKMKILRSDRAVFMCFQTVIEIGVCEQFVISYVLPDLRRARIHQCLWCVSMCNFRNTGSTDMLSFEKQIFPGA